MTKDGLIEVLSHQLHAEMGDEPNSSCGACRHRATLLMPLVVDFVAAWIATQAKDDGCYFRILALIDHWREKMGDEAVTT